MTPIAVTGATGFIGRNVCEHLTGLGHDIRPVPRATLWSPQLVDSFRDVGAVVHVAGISEAARSSAFSSINVAGTRAVARAAARAGAHVIFVSSLAASGPAAADRPHAPGGRSSPVTPYGESKLQGERELEAAGAPWTALRPGPIYGPRDRAFLRLFRYARRGWLPLTGRADAFYSFVYIGDFVRVVAAAIARGPLAGPIVVGHSRPINLLELVSGIRDNVNPKARIVRVPLPLSGVAAAAMHLTGLVLNRPQPMNRWRFRELSAEGFVCRADRLREEFGVEPEVDLQTGLRLTAEWYRREGWV